MIRLMSCSKQITLPCSLAVIDVAFGSFASARRQFLSPVAMTESGYAAVAEINTASRDQYT